MKSYIMPVAEVIVSLPENYCSDPLSSGNYAGNAGEISDGDYD